MARISQETIDRIRNSADIVDVVSQYVNLKKRGRNFFGLCPFHDERTPSFSVAPEKEIYHCFGCGAGGSVFNFIMEHENLSFVEAVQQLGLRYGIEVALSGESGSKQFFTQLYELHEIAATAYTKNLFSDPGKAALDYLLERGLTEETLKEYRVGFAPDAWEFLTEKVKGQGYSRESVNKSGLFGKGKQGVVDRFRSRIMFPIMNRTGKVIAFGGRVFDSDDPAKYMNSPETPLYRKSEVFYGYHKTAPAVRSAGSAVMVEGYMDFLQLIQAGIDNVLAVSGTAFTTKHAVQIGKITQKVYLAYDGDEAGQKASLRAGYALLQNGIAALVVRVPEGLDPDDWVRKEGGDTIRTGIEKAVPLLTYHLEKTGALDLPAVERSNLVKEILEEIAGVNDGIIRDDLLQTLANKLKINEQEMIKQFRNAVNRKRKPPQIKKSKPAEPTLFTTVAQKAQIEIISAMLTAFHDVKKIVEKNINLITEPLLNKTVQLLLEHSSGTTAEVLEEFKNKGERETVAGILMNENKVDDPLTVVQECIHTLKTHPIREKIQQTRLEIRELEAAGKDSSDLILVVGRLHQQLKQKTETDQ